MGAFSWRRLPARASVAAIDVTDDASMRAGVRAVEDADGAVGILINNAGYSQSGAIESVSMDRVRRQFETNVFGTIAMTQLVLPGMRRQRYGRIVNLSSMGGKLTFPGGGLYHGSKYAIEAITHALRFEVAGFGVAVIVIEPGLIKSGFAEAAAASVAATEDDGTPYGEFNASTVRVTRDAYERGPLVALGGTSDTVARVIARGIAAPKPHARYAVTPSAKLMIGLRKLIPELLWDAFVVTQYPRPH